MTDYTQLEGASAPGDGKVDAFGCLSIFYENAARCPSVERWAMETRERIRLSKYPPKWKIYFYDITYLVAGWVLQDRGQA